MKLIVFSTAIIFASAIELSPFRVLPQNQALSIPDFLPNQNDLKFINFSTPNLSLNPFSNLKPFELQSINSVDSISIFFQQLFNSFNSNSFALFRQNIPSSSSASQNIILQTLETVFEQFQKTVNKTLSRGIENVKASIEQLNSIAQQTISRVSNLSALKAEKFDEEIKNFNQTIQKCISKNVFNYREILTGVFNESVYCVNYKVQNGINIIEKGKNDIAVTVNGASDLSSALQECFANNNFDCYLSAIVNIRSETISLPLRLTRRFTEITAYVESTSQDLAECETLAAQSISSTINNCIFERQ